MLTAGYGNFRLIENALLVEPGPAEEQRRTWRERLLSWPWRPWVKTKIVIPMVPKKEVFVLSNQGVIVGHPVIIRQLREQLEKERLENKFLNNTEGKIIV